MSKMDAKVNAESPLFELIVVGEQSVREDKLWTSHKGAEMTEVERASSTESFSEFEPKELQETPPGEAHHYPCQDKRSHLEDDNFSEIDYNHVESLHEKIFVEDFITDLFPGDRLSKERREEDSTNKELEYRMNPQWNYLEAGVIIN